MISPKCGLPEGGGSVHSFCRNASILWQPRQDVSDKNNLECENAGTYTYLYLSSLDKTSNEAVMFSNLRMRLLNQ